MGVCDFYCVICGNPYHSLYYEKDNKTIDLSYTKWMKNCIFLTASDFVINDCEEVSSNCTYVSKHFRNVDFNGTPDKYYLLRGIFVHKDCYKYTEKYYGIKLKYSFFSSAYNDNLHMGGDTSITEYWNQDLEVEKILQDKKEHYLHSPLKSCDKNIKRINKIIKSYKLKLNKKGPSISASFEKNNVYRMGNDNCMWQKKSGKWLKINNELIRTKTELAKLNYKKISQYGEESDKPIFLHINPNGEYFVIKLLNYFFHIEPSKP